MDQKVMRRTDTDEIGVRELFAAAWKAKWIVLGITSVFTIAGAIAGLLIVKQYRAEIIISPVSDSTSGMGGGLSNLVSQYSELASMAGISMPGKGTKEEAIAVLQSELITETYVRDNNLLPILYAKRWDDKAKKWMSNDPKKIPSLWKANQYFKKTLREIKQDKQSGLVTMRITWRDPVAAAKWANDLVKITNQYLRDKAIKESEQNIAYLNEEAAKTSMVEARTAIYSILKGEVNKQMIARGREEYALKVIDPARTPELSSSPSALLLAALGFAAGLILSSVLIWHRSSIYSTHAV
jgi:uncharacterized protein involved in exopolysaccharide biosynthesis